MFDIYLGHNFEFTGTRITYSTGRLKFDTQTQQKRNENKTSTSFCHGYIGCLL